MNFKILNEKYVDQITILNEKCVDQITILNEKCVDQITIFVGDHQMLPDITLVHAD